MVFSVYLMLILSVFLVIIFSYIFVDGLESAQRKMRWTETFTGSIVSPVFTSFPELVVILVAIFGVGSSTGNENQEYNMYFNHGLWE